MTAEAVTIVATTELEHRQSSRVTGGAMVTANHRLAAVAAAV